ncbi:MAG: periplasmic heavy metal sensor [Phycisphaeraceae bacterium]|nr:periplasmic heavy metal sensor [Phycisphaerales bacterium]QOJ18194.1 MAG: periplasmic heavy metal sensor [Phycisphaeraceae bacterium]
MRQSLIPLALALSLLFNGFFVIGYLQGRQINAALPEEERVTRLVTDELRLSDSQQRVYRELRANLHDAVHDLEARLAQVQLALIDAVNQPNPDFVEILRLMDQKTLLDQERVGLASRHFGEFVRTLTPAQKAELKRRIEQGGWRSESSTGAPRQDGSEPGQEAVDEGPDGGSEPPGSGGDAEDESLNDLMRRLGDQSPRR